VNGKNFNYDDSAGKLGESKFSGNHYYFNGYVMRLGELEEGLMSEGWRSTEMC